MVIGDAFAKTFYFTQSHPTDQFFGSYLEEQLIGGHVRLQRPPIYGMRRLNYFSVGTIFWDFTCGGATLRRTYDVGPNW